MIIPDVNLLVYAVFDGYPQHERAVQWLTGALNGAETVGLTAPAIFGFVRLATSARIHGAPLSVAAVQEYVREWLARPQVQFLTPGPEHVGVALRLLERVGTGPTSPRMHSSRRMPWSSAGRSTPMTPTSADSLACPGRTRSAEPERV